MKRNLLRIQIALLTPLFIAGSLNAQCSATTPTAANVNVPCGTPATLTATGSSGYQWWDQPSGGTLLGSGSTYVTSNLTANTSYFVEGSATTAQTMMPLPAYSSTFTGNVRGYWFTAPVDFTITGLDIPTQVSGLQNIAVVRLAAAPPLYSTTTNAFTLLYLTQNNATVGMISVNIPVMTGDIIGILGQAGSNNAYAPTNFPSTIAGQPVTLARLGMQYPLATTSPQDLWTETSGSISNVEMYYTTTCTSSRVQVDVTVDPITVTASAQSSTICAGTSTTLDAGGAVNYTWMPGNLTGSSVTVNPSSTTTYTVTGDDGGSCTNTAMVTVTVNPLPTVVANTTASTICDGDMVTLTGSGATSYSWDNSVADGVAFTPSVTTTYMVTGTDANGCSNVDAITVTVNPLPTVVANSTAAAVCSGGMVTLTGSGATSYTWDNSVTDGVAFAPAGTTTYMVTGTDANGCVGTDMTTVTVNALPVVDLGADVVQCGGSVTLDAGNAGSTFLWSDASSSQTDMVSASATYYVDVTDMNGCSGSDTVMVTINTPPTVTGTAAASTACFDDANVALTGTPANGTWSGAGVTGSSFDPSAAGNGAHVCTYTFTDVNGCTNTATVTITVNACTGVAENSSLGNSFSMFPNPNAGTFMLSVNANVGDLNIELFDMNGRIVYTSHESNVSAGFIKQISTENISNGVYMLRLTTSTEDQMVKVSVQK